MIYTISSVSVKSDFEPSAMRTKALSSFSSRTTPSAIMSLTILRVLVDRDVSRSCVKGRWMHVHEYKHKERGRVPHRVRQAGSERVADPSPGRERPVRASVEDRRREHVESKVEDRDSERVLVLRNPRGSAGAAFGPDVVRRRTFSASSASRSLRSFSSSLPCTDGLGSAQLNMWNIKADLLPRG